MVVIRWLLITTLCLAPWARADAAPVPTPSLSKPAEFPAEPNQPAEDFFIITLISLPFTALWSFAGATVIASVAQRHFPPEYDLPLLSSAAGASLGASLLIGAISVAWGKGKAHGR